MPANITHHNVNSHKDPQEHCREMHMLLSSWHKHPVMHTHTYSTHTYSAHTVFRPPSGKAGLLPHEHPHSATVHLPLQGETKRSRFHCKLTCHKMNSFQWLLSWLLHKQKVFCYQLEIGKHLWIGLIDRSFSRHQSEIKHQQRFSDY